MSAAEKLKALERRANLVSLGVDILGYSDEWCAGFLLGQENALSAVALPQIVAVVEAASESDLPVVMLNDRSYDGWGRHCAHCYGETANATDEIVHDAKCPGALAAVALAALNEALDVSR